MADLELRAISKRFDKGLVLDNISLKVPDGTFCDFARPLRVRQIDSAADYRRIGTPYVRTGLHRWSAGR